MITNELVVWVGDPETSWSLIGVQETHRSLGHHDQIVGDVVLSLSGILNEDGVSLNIESNIVHESQVVGSMDGKSTIETFVNGNTVSV